MPPRKTGRSPRRVFSFSVEDLAKLEALRDHWGLKSDAAVVRKLIREAANRNLPKEA